jgi:hypothetical protein
MPDENTPVEGSADNSVASSADLASEVLAGIGDTEGEDFIDDFGDSQQTAPQPPAGDTDDVETLKRRLAEKDAELAQVRPAAQKAQAEHYKKQALSQYPGADPEELATLVAQGASKERIMTTARVTQKALKRAVERFSPEVEKRIAAKTKELEEKVGRPLTGGPAPTDDLSRAIKQTTSLEELQRLTSQHG